MRSKRIERVERVSGVGAEGTGRAGEASEGDGIAAGPASKPLGVVGIGAADDGALAALFSNVAAGTGMAFVVVSKEPSEEDAATLVEALGKVTTMPVCAAAQGDVALEPDHVYVTPPGRAASYADGRLVVEPRPGPAPRASRRSR